MIEILRTIGSFATTWLAIWLACALALLLIYPLVRRHLFNWHPAVASRLLLLLLAFPVLLSLSTTAMLFVPAVESNLVTAHCHENCQSHFPLINSVWVSAAGLALTLVILGIALHKLLFNLQAGRRLMSQLMHLAQKKGQWQLLPDSRPLVFTLGWWHNQVFITQGLLQQCAGTDIEIILHHEYEHVRRFDNMRLLLAKLFLLVLPGNLAQRFYKDLHFLTESACDFAAAEKHGELEVAETLLRVQKLVPQEFNYFHSPLLAAFTGSEVELRIRNLAGGSGQFLNLHYGQTAFVFVLVGLSFALVDPMHHGIEWLLELL